MSTTSRRCHISYMLLNVSLLNSYCAAHCSIKASDRCTSAYMKSAMVHQSKRRVGRSWSVSATSQICVRYRTRYTDSGLSHRTATRFILQTVRRRGEGGTRCKKYREEIIHVDTNTLTGFLWRFWAGVVGNNGELLQSVIAIIDLVTQQSASHATPSNKIVGLLILIQGMGLYPGQIPDLRKLHNQ
jgi:hypothetical protein